MRNIATCYSEHAVKVSDSYCSGPLNKSYISPKPTPSIQNVVSCTYKTQISDKKRLFITVTWCSKLICQGFFIKFSGKNNQSRDTNNSLPHGFHHMPKTKGSSKVLHHDYSGGGTRRLNVSIHWDLSRACYDSGPKPVKGYYIAIEVDSELSLVIGDMRNDSAVQSLVRGLKGVEDLSLVSQCEHFYNGNNNTITRNNNNNNSQIVSKVRFNDSGEEHEIMIKCGADDEGPRSPGISVYIDKKRVVRIKRLQWNFRGNQVIFVDGLLVDVMWDVFGWYFDQTLFGKLNNNNNNNNINQKTRNGNGFIMFRTRSGLDSRLWLEEEESKLADKINGKPEFSLLICASSNNPG